jgi:hypothetical protein
MKSSLFFTLICSLSITTFAAGSELVVFDHASNNPITWLESAPHHPEHIYLTVALTRAFWTKLLILPQETTDGICPTLAVIATGVFPSLTPLVDRMSMEDEDASAAFEELSLTHAKAEDIATESSEEEESSEEYEESSEEYESEEYKESYDSDNPDGAFNNEIISIANGFYDLLILWKSMPRLEPFVENMLETFEDHRKMGHDEASANSLFNSIMMSFFSELVTQISFERCEYLNSGLNALIKKIINPS